MRAGRAAAWEFYLKLLQLLAAIGSYWQLLAQTNGNLEFGGIRSDDWQIP